MPAPQPRDMTVMIVEDDPEMLEYLERIVKGGGFRAATAADGLELLKKLEGPSPQLIVLDLMLPKYGGFELLYELRRAAPGVPLVVVTARFNAPKDRTLIMKQPHVAAFFEKPLTPEVLLNAVHEILGTTPPKP